MSLLRVSSSSKRSALALIQTYRSFCTTPVRKVEPSAQKDPQLGDYPDFEPVSRQWRRWNPKWWDQQEKRNFGETLHESDDTLSVWAPDVHKISGPSALFQFSIAAACMGAFAGLVYLTYPEKPAIPRVYPDGGLVKALGEGRKRAPIESDFIKEDEEEEE
ncbi:hypothetical protein IE81DRAFT_324421 [Ceraceosorus guamensis]|uniref:Uncharacterized protein n=1 Tax=Ceraceosorus guamensis TaxID=1522189 RepID=A0A316VYU1_9BASI|nr:hypothetical protein IE81DRAFT_324421 [Ceraceosorus guamensis]PWN41563.1 hypothetical protein IE81DRAFT_324421 [Ceraceosorus guamensis]